MNGDVENHDRFIAFFVLNGDLNRVDAVVNPRVIQHAGGGEDAFVIPCSRAIIKGHIEFTRNIPAVLVIASTGVDENGFLGHADGNWRYGCRQASHEEFNASDVVLEIGIGGVQAPSIRFPLDLEGTDAGAVGHGPHLEHFVRLIRLQRRQFLSDGDAVGRGQTCVGHR